MPFVPAALHFAVRTDLSKEQPALKLLDTQLVLTFHIPKFESQGPHDKPNPKLELAAKGCQSILSPKVRTFDALTMITDQYWDVNWLGLVGGDDALISLGLRACDIMRDLATSGGSEARALYQAIVTRRRLQLQFAFGEHIRSSVIVDIDHQLSAR